VRDCKLNPRQIQFSQQCEEIMLLRIAHDRCKIIELLIRDQLEQVQIQILLVFKALVKAAPGNARPGKMRLMLAWSNECAASSSVATWQIKVRLSSGKLKNVSFGIAEAYRSDLAIT
jgi:hypothetical protein